MMNNFPILGITIMIVKMTGFPGNGNYITVLKRERKSQLKLTWWVFFLILRMFKKGGIVMLFHEQIV